MAQDMNDVLVSHRMHSGGIRKTIVTPHPVPRASREAVARAIIETIQNSGASGMADSAMASRLVSVTSSVLWNDIRREALKNDSQFHTVFAEVFRTVLNDLDTEDSLASLNSEMKERSEIMDILESIFPGRNFEDSYEYIYSQLFFDGAGHAGIIRKKDALRWISEIMRHHESELIKNPAEHSDAVSRPVMILTDTSRSMFGEPEVIAKAVILSVAKRMLSENRDVDIIFMSSDGLIRLNMDSRKEIEQDFIDLLMFGFGSGSEFGKVVDHALGAMKQGLWKGRDIIMISKGQGVRNGITLAREWETYKTFNNARTFAVAAASDGVKGLTELSDNIYIMDDDSITNTKGEYSRLIRDLH